jgi:hypothetical protein
MRRVDVCGAHDIVSNPHALCATNVNPPHN